MTENRGMLFHHGVLALYDGKPILQPQERAFEELVGQPGDKHRCGGDDDVYQYCGSGFRQLYAGVAIERGETEYQQRMDDIDAVGYLSNEIAHFVFQIDDGVV